MQDMSLCQFHQTWTPINSPEYQMDVCAPKWKEVEQAVRKARDASSPGPNGVVQSVQECFRSSTNSVEIDKSGMEKTIVPRAWHRPG